MLKFWSLMAVVCLLGLSGIAGGPSAHRVATAQSAESESGETTSCEDLAILILEMGLEISDLEDAYGEAKDFVKEKGEEFSEASRKYRQAARRWLLLADYMRRKNITDEERMQPFEDAWDAAKDAWDSAKESADELLTELNNQRELREYWIEIYELNCM